METNWILAVALLAVIALSLGQTVQIQAISASLQPGAVVSAQTQQQTGQQVVLPQGLQNLDDMVGGC